MSQSVRDLLSSDVDNKLKLVSAGMKVIERKINNKSGVVEHRLVQVDGVFIVYPSFCQSVSVPIYVFVNQFCV